ncbi:ATP synthase mitochondrial F1 complex assembly factor 2 [Halotydeus destructor]|nr:ATP synthase mitochondrial F1 complex assembly factor 2 [Halotydeus destructor]
MLSRSVLSLILNSKFINLQPARSLTTLRKKFYKEVSTTQNDKKYEINLDGRKLKTPTGAVLSLGHEGLAMAVANEWRTQQEHIRPTEMHLTALANTSSDNPMKNTTETLVNQLIDFLHTDTICFRTSEPEDLYNLEKDKWDPITNWFQERFDCQLPITDAIVSPGVPPETLAKLEKHLSSYSVPALYGMQFITENLKSLILCLAVTEFHVDVNEATALSRLETEYQIAKWGRVEWSHDLDMTQTCSRVSAGLLYVTFNSESYVRHDKVSER